MSGSCYALAQGRYSQMSEKNKIDKKYIDKCSDGWIKKVEQLYSQIEETLKNEPEVEYKTDQMMLMREELMEKYGIPPKKVPIFDLFIAKQLKATFKPVGLWVVGAKGRIDILTQEGAYTLVDTGDDDTFPNWKVFSSKNKGKGEPFNTNFIEQLVH